MIAAPPGAGRGRDPLALVEQAAIAEEILAALRHAMGNRLSTIRNAAFYVRRRLPEGVEREDPRAARFLEMIDEEIVAAHALVGEGAARQRLAPRRVEPTCAAACARAAVALARLAGDGVRVELVEAPGDVDADAGELTLAIRCLVENAAEAMGGGGVVTVRAGPEGDQFLVEVSDEGPGIAEADRGQVQRAFHTTKPGHAGLGLSIAGRVARSAGGALRILPREAGASVALVLPRSGAAPAG